jgi:hypothetical protein
VHPRHNPVQRLSTAMDGAAEALREAMHAISDLPATEVQLNDWYAEIGQLHLITTRSRDLAARMSLMIRTLPTYWMDSRDGVEPNGHINAAADCLGGAVRDLGQASALVNSAWSEIAQVRDAGGSR